LAHNNVDENLFDISNETTRLGTVIVRQTSGL